MFAWILFEEFFCFLNSGTVSDETAWTSELLQSRMHSSGQLNNDLALSDSDDEERMEAIKRGDTADNLLDSF